MFAFLRNFYVEAPNPSVLFGGDVFRKALTSWWNACLLKNNSDQSSFALFATWGPSEKVDLCTSSSSWLSPRPYLPAPWSWTSVRNKSLLFKLFSYGVLWQPKPKPTNTVWFVVCSMCLCDTPSKYFSGTHIKWHFLFIYPHRLQLTLAKFAVALWTL